MASLGVICVCILLTVSLNCSTGEELRYDVIEESDAGFVGNPVSDSKLPTNPSQIQFNFVSPNNSQSRFFSIDHETGEIRTSEPLDREVICVVGSCPVNLDVAVQSATSELELIRILRVRIHLFDINDNTPAFPSSTVNIEILESTPIETTFPVPAATDPDSPGNNSQVSYQLHPADGFGKFGMSVIKNWDGSTDIGIIVKETLDREATDFYQVRIIAKDAGSPSLTGTLAVNISITDSNDHAPVFAKPLWNVTIYENVTMGTEILRLSTTDKDVGTNGRVTYKFSPRSVSKVGSVFEIDKATGAIKTVGTVDFESATLYQIMVEATDNGIPPKSARSAVVIRVLDVNDNSPDISFNLLAGGDHALVSEFAKPGSFVAHVSVADPDTDMSQRIECQMDSSEFSLQRMSQKEYKIILLAKLDRENTSEYNLTVACEDNGTPVLKAENTVLVRVKDENDHPPVFQQTKYSVTIPENYPVGESIVQVSALDSDTGENGNVTYTLVNNMYNFLSIDSSTGVVVARKALDRENGTTLTVGVVAMDKGKTQLSATSTLEVTLTDVNDVAPVFTRTEYEVSIPENQYVHVDIRPFNVSDPDTGPGGEFYFTLVESTAASGVFLVSQLDGSIKTVQMFDREERSEYKLVVMATDRGSPPLSSSATVMIKIEDINDNDPVILYPTNSNNSVQILTWEVDTYVATVKAFDRDHGENGRLTYNIQDDEDTEFLYIDHKSGLIRLAHDIDETFAGGYDVTILVKDHGNPEKYARKVLNVFVTSVNGTAAVSTKGSNMAIVIAVVAITLIVSLAILIGICVIRKQDKTKRTQPPQVEEEKIMQRRGSSSTASKTSQQSDLSTVTCLDELRKDISFGISEDSHGFPSGPNSMAPCYLFRSYNQGLTVKDSDHLEILDTAYLDQKYDALSPGCHTGDEFGRLYSENNNMIKGSPDSSDTLTNSDSGRGGSDEDLNDKLRMSNHPGTQWHAKHGEHYVRFIRPGDQETENPREKALKLSSFKQASPKRKQKEENYYYDMTAIRKMLHRKDHDQCKGTNGETYVPPSSRPVSVYTTQPTEGVTTNPVSENGRSLSQMSLPQYYMKPYGDKSKMSNLGSHWSRTDSRGCSIELENLNTSTNI